ncbi:MAG: AAA family ATPase [Lachnospiraceae bacterium]|nr:AAA family ATPase [Lachnospiraceae bacterium]
MNIAQAKTHIKDSVRMYLKKDERGDYRIPFRFQRPVFLIGAPGIGKTAIMEQIASELGIALVSYSMTHHTRQSALGLPYLTDKEYGKETFSVTEYTMSEIIASVYDTMEKSGVSEGILFLDEINCVSETLAPSMLQFLQYKTFGRHSLPEGWIIVTAGNPTLYNRSAREFDVVTMDRLKVMEVEQDYEAFRIYARGRGLHPAIMSFLETKKEYFYHIATTAKGREYVTARGWEDLSVMITLYEEDGLAVTEDLVSQYIRSEKITREFTSYYDLYGKYKKEYDPMLIAAGKASETLKQKALAAPFDEQLAITQMLTDLTVSQMRSCMEEAGYLSDAAVILRAFKDKSKEEVKEGLEKACERKLEQLNSKKSAGALSPEDEKRNKRCIDLLSQLISSADDFEGIKTGYEEKVRAMKQRASECRQKAENVFDFVAGALDETGNMLVFVTELTQDKDAASFIAAFGCESYQKYSESLMVSQRMEGVSKKIEELNLN